MEIVRGMEIVGSGLLIKSMNALVVSDLHIGYEHALSEQGISLPKSQYGRIKREIERLMKSSGAERLILNGDIKHEFSEVSRQEWVEINDFLDFVEKYNPIFIRGNHDNFLISVLRKRSYEFLPYFIHGDVMIMHGDSDMPGDAGEGVRVVIIGNEHPAYAVRDEFGSVEKFKCFVKGRVDGKVLIVLPALNPIMPGSEINNADSFLSPILNRAKLEKAYVIESDRVFTFDL